MTLKHSPELAELKLRYQKHGLLLSSKKSDGPAIKTIKMFGKHRVISYGWAENGGWDTYTSIGSVHTDFFAIRKIMFLSEDDTLLSGVQIVIGPLIMSFSL